MFSSLENEPTVFISSSSNDFFEFYIKNNNIKKVSSIKIERRDDWRFEKSFSIKTDENQSNKCFHFFDSDGIVRFTDKLVTKDRAFSYKITCYNLSGFPVAYVLTSPLKIGDSYSNTKNLSLNKNNPKIKNFDIEVINKNQNPKKVKFSWKIDGDWSYLVIKDGSRNIRVDNFHSFALINFEKSLKYDLSVELYDNEKKIVDTRRGMIINL
jgi:hypothetical protein